MRIQESGEMYLEAIYMLSKKGSAPRSVDVGEYMGYIEIDKEGLITLTKSGEDLAYKIYERHTILAEFLKNLGVSDEVASEDACKIEHVLSDESFSAIKEHINKISTEE
jgi:Mn-dependent DtxR family transcriptional regulator